MLTYAERSFCGVKKTCSPGESNDTKGGMEGYGFGEIHRRCISWHCFNARHSYRKLANIGRMGGLLRSGVVVVTSWGSSYRLKVNRSSRAASTALIPMLSFRT